MTTSSNINIFRVTGPWWGESIGKRWIPSKKLVAQSIDIIFGLRLNKRLSKQSRRMWFETPSDSLWRHCNTGICVSLTFPVVGQWALGKLSSAINKRSRTCVDSHEKKRRQRNFGWMTCVAGIYLLIFSYFYPYRYFASMGVNIVCTGSLYITRFIVKRY